MLTKSNAERFSIALFPMLFEIRQADYASGGMESFQLPRFRA